VGYKETSTRSSRDLDIAVALESEARLGAAAMRARLAGRLFGENRSAPKLGRFEVLELLGSGGLGIVYLARDPVLDRHVALKVMRDIRPGNALQRRRVLREAQALAKLNHPNIVGIYEVGEHDDTVFIAMEHVDGSTLQDLERRRPPFAQLLDLYRQAGAGLAAAHARGFVHRDFKPANVLVGRDGRARVADFGLAATPADQQPDVPLETDRDSVPTPRSRAGGTPRYMAPEQLAARAATRASDQFSFCVALHHAVYGVFPYPLQALASAARSGVPLELETPNTKGPPWLGRLLARGLALHPEQRYPSFEALLGELREGPARRRRKVAAMSTTGALAVVAAVSVTAADAEHCPDPSVLLASTWGPQRRHAVAQALEQAQQPYAEATARALLSGFDLYASRWADARGQACHQTLASTSPKDTALASRSIRCLDRGRARFHAATSMATDIESNPGILLRADDVLAELGVPARCANAAVDITENAPALSEQEIAAFEHTLDEIGLLYATAEYDRSTTRAEALASELRQRGAGSLEAYALLQLGQSHDAKGAHDHAVTSFFAALAADQRHDVPEVAARSWSSLARLAARDLEDSTRAAHWLTMAESAVTRAGGSTELTADLDQARGEIALLHGEPDDAAAAFTRAVDLLRADPNTQPTALATALVRLANATTLAGHTERGDRLYEEALQLRRTRQGNTHPDVAAVEFDMALTALARAEYSRADALLGHVLDVDTATFGPASIRVAKTLLLQAQVAQGHQDWQTARARADAADAILRTELPAGHSERLSGLRSRAWAEFMLGEYEQAWVTSIEELAEQPEDEDPEQRTQALNNVAWLGEATGRLTLAAEHANAVLDRLPPRHPSTAYAHSVLAAIAFSGNDAETARGHTEAGLAIATSQDEPDDWLVAELRWRHALALHHAGHTAAGQEAARIAISELGDMPRAARARTELETLLDGAATASSRPPTRRSADADSRASR